MKIKYLTQFILIISAVFLICMGGCGKNTTPDSISEDSFRQVSLQLPYGIEAHSAGYYAALSQGYYYDEGLDVTILNGSNQTRPEDSVLSGKALFGVTTLPRLIQLKSQEKPITHLAQILYTSGNLLVWKTEGPIKSPIDLLHHKVILPPNGLGNEFYLYLAHNRISPQNILISENPKGIELFLKGDADMVMLDTFSTDPELMAKKPESMVLSVSSAAFSPWGLPQDCIFAKEETLNEEKDLTLKFVRATIKGWKYVLTNPKETVSLMSDYDKMNLMDKEREFQSLRELVKHFYKDTNGQMMIGFLSRERLNEVNSLMAQYQLIPKPVDDNLLPQGFMDEIYKTKLE